MHSTTIYITDDQRTFFKIRKKVTGIPVAVQIREALDMYIKKNKIGSDKK